MRQNTKTAGSKLDQQIINSYKRKRTTFVSRPAANSV